MHYAAHNTSSVRHLRRSHPAASTSGHVDAYGIQSTPPSRSSSVSISIPSQLVAFHLPTLLCKPRMGLSSAHISMLSNTLVSSGCVRRPQGKVTSLGLKPPHHGPWQKRLCRLHACGVCLGLSPAFSSHVHPVCSTGT